MDREGTFDMRGKGRFTIHVQHIPSFVVRISRRLMESGYQAFIVGGALRDSLLGRKAQDWDVATDARPADIHDLFPDMTRFELRHGTVTLVSKGRHFEVTTYRGTGGYGGSIEEDLSHRDFTLNAMAYDIANQGIVDPFGGKEDIKNRVVRAVLDPIERYGEDPLRMLRAIRFSVQLGYSIEPQTLMAISSMAQAIDRIAQERIRDELLRILTVHRPSIGFKLMRNTGLLKWILPEVLEGYRKKQDKYHTYTIYRHTMETVDCIDRDPFLRLSALFHDIAKPRVRKKINGRWRFLGHATVSAELAREIMLRLRFSNEEIHRVTHLVAHHMFDYTTELSDKALRRFIKRIGKEHIDDLISLRKADDLAHGPGKVDENQIEEFRNRVHAQLEKSYPLRISDLAVNGNDVMDILGLQPGPRVGEVLSKLLDVVLEDRGHNQRDNLIGILEDMKER